MLSGGIWSFLLADAKLSGFNHMNMQKGNFCTSNLFMTLKIDFSNSPNLQFLKFAVSNLKSYDFQQLSIHAKLDEQLLKMT